MVYLAATSPGQVAHPAFKQRAITGLTATKLSELPLLGVAHAKEIAYAGYKDNIDIFISATSRQHKLRTDAPGAHLNLDRDEYPLSVPPVTYIPGITLTNDQTDGLVAKFVAMDPTKKVVGKTTKIILNKPDMKKAESLVMTSLGHIIADADTINPKAFLAATYCSHIIAEFLATMTYPAWRSEDQRGDDEEVLSRQDYKLKVVASKKRVAAGSRLKKKRDAPTATDGEDVTMEAVEEETEIEEATYELKWDSLRESVLVAKPSPLPASRNYGGPADVPESPGLVFPYFDRMLIPETTSIRDVIGRYFLRCLGDSRKEQRRIFGIIKTGLDGLTRTKVGAELMHIFAGIRLALETQTRLFLVVVSGEYAGFCLLGARFSVLVGDVWYDAKEPEDLQTDVDMLSSHSWAITELCKAMSVMEMKDIHGVKMPKEELRVEDIENGHDLWEALQKRKVPDDDVDTITEYLRCVTFSRSYRDINVANIRWALDMIVKTPQEPLPRDTPLYVPAALSQLDDRVLRVLSTFGPDSFSFQNISGIKYTITPASRIHDANEDPAESGKGKHLSTMIVAVKGVLTCAVDMHKTLKDKMITMNQRERAQKHRCIVFQGAQRDLIYEKLREVVEIREPRLDGALGTGKRPREEDNAPKTAADLLAMF